MQVLHGDPVGVIVFPKIEDLRHVGMRDPRGDTRFVEEHVHELVIFDQVRMDSLDCYPFLKPTRPVHTGKVNTRHPADAYLINHAVAAEKKSAGWLGLAAGCPVRRRPNARGAPKNEAAAGGGD